MGGKKGGWSGAISGAITGAVIGTKVGGWWGALIGFIVGGVAGYFWGGFATPKAPKVGKTNFGAGTSHSYGSFGTVDNTLTNKIPVAVVLGRMKVYGNIVWQSEPGETVKQIVVLCEGAVDRIEDIRINDEPYASYPGVTITPYYGTGSQTADSRVSSLSSMNLRYFAYLAVTLKASEKLSGKSTISCVVYGEKIETWDSSIGYWDRRQSTNGGDGTDGDITISTEKNINTDIIGLTEVDYMEYATNVLAQAAYVSSGVYVYASQYPTQDADHVKATNYLSDSFMPHFTTDPTKALTGNLPGNAWVTAEGITTNMRFHIDLGSAKAIERIYYENGHNAGGYTDRGVKNFTFWGSNTADSFAELTYGTDTGWTQITPAQSTFDQHVAENQADPKYITVTSTIAYRYYAFKFADNYGYSTMNIRRIELQTGSVVLQSYSESTIKWQGSYSLKGIAKQTDSLNDTLTRTVSPTINMTAKDTLYLNVRASRTGSNFKIEFHDAGGNTISHTVNIAAANTWQTETIDISAVADADKDAIDQIKITILNADADNTFYLDDIYACRNVAHGITYNVTAFGESGGKTTITTSGNPDGIAAGDEILALCTQGRTGNVTNVGNYEFLTVESVSGNIITCTALKTKYYGTGASDDNDIGVSNNVGSNEGEEDATNDNRVVIQRIPNYETITITKDGTLTCDYRTCILNSHYESTTSHSVGRTSCPLKGGIVAFRARKLVLNGSIDTSGKGYQGGWSKYAYGHHSKGSGSSGESIDTFPYKISGSRTLVPAHYGAGGGGSGWFSEYTQAGSGGHGKVGKGALPGGTYGDKSLTKIYFGSSGGSRWVTEGSNDKRPFGGAGGGIIFIDAKEIEGEGLINANGAKGSQYTITGSHSQSTFIAMLVGGEYGGAGGSIKLIYESIATTIQIEAKGGYGSYANGGDSSNRILPQIKRWSENPAALIRHILLNKRWGMGKDIDEIDDASFADAYDYCNELVGDGAGGTEPRFRLNYIMDDLRPAADYFQDLLATFRATFIFEGRKIKLHIDRPCSYDGGIAFNFGDGSSYDEDNYDNIEADSFKWQLPPLDNLANKYIVHWIDPDQKYVEVTTERNNVIDQRNRGVVLISEVSLLGIQYQSQASRECKYLESINTYSAVSISWGGFGDCKQLEVGDVITMTYKGALYSKKQFRITEIQQLPFEKFQFNAIEYNESIYDDKLSSSIITYVPPEGPNIFAPLSDVTGLTVTEATYLNSDGILIACIDVSWIAISDDQLTRLSFYQIEYSSDEGDTYIMAGLVSPQKTSFRITALQVNTEYLTRVKTVSEKGVISDGAVSSAITLTGDHTLPNDVEDFAVNFINNQLMFIWKANIDVDLSGYEIRVGGSTFDTSSILATQITGTIYTTSNFQRGTWTYFIKAIDYSGNYSANAMSDIITITSTLAENIIKTHTEWKRLPVMLGHNLQGTLSIDMELGMGNEYNENYYRRVLCPKTELTFDELEAAYSTIQAVEDAEIKLDTLTLDEQTYETKSIELAAYKIYGTLYMDYQNYLENSGYGTVIIQYSTSDDNISWADWKTFQMAEIQARYLKFKIKLQAVNVLYQVKLIDFNMTFVVSDITDEGSNVDIAASGTTINFNVFFTLTPRTVVATVIDASGSQSPIITNLTRVNFKVTIYDKDDIAIAGKINWLAVGAGGRVT